MIIIIIIAIVILTIMIKNKIFIRIDTFFRKGFPKNDDKYGIYCFTGKQGSGKTYSVIDFLEETRRKDQIVLTNVYSYYISHKKISKYCEQFGDIVKLCEERRLWKKIYYIL